MTTSYLDTASRIGAQLAREAVWDGRRCNWFGAMHEQFGGVMQQGMGTLGPCVYDGTAGIGLFLARLYQATGDTVFARTAAGAVEHALSRQGDVPREVALGYYTGVFGIGHAGVQVGAAIDDADMVVRALALVKAATELNTEGRFVLDVMSGYAGTVAPLLAMHQAYGHQWLLDGALRAGKVLLAHAVESERGISWDTTSELARMVALMGMPAELAASLTPTAERPHLTGFSHGSAGIAWALLELGTASGNAAMVRAARGGIAYEDSWFDGACGQWSDLRCDHGQPQTQSAANIAWCHGASGIALTRLRALQLTGDAHYMASLQAAMRITAKAIEGNLAGENNFSLCHGLAGDAEIFLRIASQFGDPASKALVERVAAYGQAQFDQPERPWPSGTNDRKENPGLMLGLAGTGYFYLSAANPARTPSIMLSSLAGAQQLAGSVASGI